MHIMLFINCLFSLTPYLIKANYPLNLFIIFDYLFLNFLFFYAFIKFHHQTFILLIVNYQFFFKVQPFFTTFQFQLIMIITFLNFLSFNNELAFDTKKLYHIIKIIKFIILINNILIYCKTSYLDKIYIQFPSPLLHLYISKFEFQNFMIFLSKYLNKSNTSLDFLFQINFFQKILNFKKSNRVFIRFIF